jgi:hypothetical protein
MRIAPVTVAASPAGPPWPHLALLVLLLLGSRSHWLPGVALVVVGGLLATMHARGLRLILRLEDGGRLGLAVIRHGAPVPGVGAGGWGRLGGQAPPVFWLPLRFRGCLPACAPAVLPAGWQAFWRYGCLLFFWLIWPCTRLAAGVLLVASDGLEHSIFRRSVVLLTQHGRCAVPAEPKQGRQLCMAETSRSLRQAGTGAAAWQQAAPSTAVCFCESA